MQRIYHHWELWEDYKFGFYNNPSESKKSYLSEKVIEMFSNIDLTEEYMNMVIYQWPISCEHNLSNKSMNRIAYLGQAACCIYANVPFMITMRAWNILTEDQRNTADLIAKKIIQKWEKSIVILRDGKKKGIQMEFLMNAQVN